MVYNNTAYVIPLKMNRRTRPERRRERVAPYSIPTETLGHVYRHVENPSAFGMVNRTFRSVNTDPHFEKQRKLQMLENDIRRNGGSRVFINKFPASSKYKKFFYNDHGCVDVVHSSEGLEATTGKNIKRVRVKAILGLQTIMGDPPFKPVGRFTIQDILDISEVFGEEYVQAHWNWFNATDEELERWCNDIVDQNIPQLRTDLLRALQSDLQNGCTPRVAWALTKADDDIIDYRVILNRYLEDLQKAEAEQYSVRQIIDAFFQPMFEEDIKIIRENVQIVGEALEITLHVKLRYSIFLSRV